MIFLVSSLKFKKAELVSKDFAGLFSASDSAVEAAVFADPHPLFPLDALAEEVVDQVIDRFGVEHLCEGTCVHQLKFHRQSTELKGVQGVGALSVVVIRHQLLD